MTIFSVKFTSFTLVLAMGKPLCGSTDLAYTGPQDPSLWSLGDDYIDYKPLNWLYI